jgi:hypothetical protein
VTVKIPAEREQVDMQLAEDEAGLYLRTALGRTTYSLRSVLNIGWRIVATTPEELALLHAHGFTIQI